MNPQELIDRIIKDAEVEGKAIIALAKKTAKGNIDYAKRNADEIINAAKATAKRNREREQEIRQNACAIKTRISELNQQTAIIGEVFNKAFDSLKFKWRVEDKGTHEIRYTREEMMADLRDKIENEVFAILFGESK